MDFARIDPGITYSSRRMKMPASLRRFAIESIDGDRRPLGQRARLSDVYINLAMKGLEDISNVTFKRDLNLKRMDGKGLVFRFPNHFYNSLEKVKAGIKDGLYPQSTVGVVDIFNIFICLAEHGQKLVESDKPKRKKSKG